jgi:hypothetical protein
MLCISISGPPTSFIFLLFLYPLAVFFFRPRALGYKQKRVGLSFFFQKIKKGKRNKSFFFFFPPFADASINMTMDRREERTCRGQQSCKREKK